MKNVKAAVKRKAIRKTGLDQDKPVNAATLETPAIEPLLDESTTVAGEGQQPTTSKACTGGSKSKKFNSPLRPIDPRFREHCKEGLHCEERQSCR